MNAQLKKIFLNDTGLLILTIGTRVAFLGLSFNLVSCIQHTPQEKGKLLGCVSPNSYQKENSETWCLFLDFFFQRVPEGGVFGICSFQRTIVIKL